MTLTELNEVQLDSVAAGTQTTGKKSSEPSMTYSPAPGVTVTYYPKSGDVAFIGCSSDPEIAEMKRVIFETFAILHS